MKSHFQSSCHFLDIMRLATHCSDIVRLFIDSPPTALSLNSQIVPVHLNPEEARFPPISAPTVPDNPKLDSVFLSPSYNCHLMVGNWNQCGLGINSSSICF